MSDTPHIREAIALAVERRDLSEAQAAAAMTELMAGAASPAQFGALAIALRMKGETIDEITGMARAMRDAASHVTVDGPLLDTCGTGGDGSGTFNVSTAAAFVAAGAGARVAKHGNRAITSGCGSADVLEALGAKIDLTPGQVAACIEASGVGFMFAQSFHPAMKHVGPARREIGVRTVFNLLGPLTNPAGARRQVIGVPREDLAEPLATVLVKLGSERVIAVHGEGGLDELSISGPTFVVEHLDGAARSYRVMPEELGLKRHDAAKVKGGTPGENAAEMHRVLEGAQGALRDFVLINAAAAIVAWGGAADLKAAVDVARESIDAGKAALKLDEFLASTHAGEGRST